MKFHDNRPDEVLDGFLKELGDSEPRAEKMGHVGESVLQRLQAPVVETTAIAAPVSSSGRFVWKFAFAGAAGLVVAALLIAVFDRDAKLQVGEVVRAREGMNLHYSLEDGSQLEIRERTELSLERASDGLNIRLVRGSVIVQAAEQRDGHLYVQTPDCTVSVIGTVFLVKAEETGSRVAVVEGEVHVQQGPELTKLLRGEQIVTSPQMMPVPVVEEISWSQDATALLAMLQQRGTEQREQRWSTDAQTGTVRGVVVREGTAEPISNVQITLATNFGPGGPGNFGRGPRTAMDATGQATSDAAGRFVLENVPVGQFVIGARREGYFGVPVSGVAPAMVSRSVEVAFQRTTEVRLTMVPASAVVGSVTGNDGAPVSGANVEILSIGYEKGGLVLQPAGTKQTDARGEYRLYPLPPGDYYLAVTPRLAAARGTAPQELPVRTFYPDVTDIASASRIALRPGEDRGGMNIGLRSAINATIFGRVISLLPPVSEPSVATLTLLPRSGSASLDSRPPVQTARVSLVNPNDGAFVLQNVPPGAYELYASMPNPSSQEKRPAYGRTSIDVRGRNVEGVAVVIHPPADLKGKVTVDGRAVTDKHMALVLEPMDSAARIQSVGQFRTGLSADGSFAISSVPEALYRLQIGKRAQQAAGAVLRRGPTPTTMPGVEFVGPDAYVADVRQGGVSVFDSGIRVGAGYADSIEVLVNTSGATVQGKVLDGNGQPVPGATVVLMPPHERRYNLVLFFAVSSDAHQGAFSIEGVQPGQYKLFSWAEVPPNAYLNADFMRQYEGRGVLVSVTSGATITQQLSIIR